MTIQSLAFIASTTLFRTSLRFTRLSFTTVQTHSSFLFKRNMATASKILVSPSLKPVYAHGTPTQASTDAVNDVLQRNHDEHHIFYDERGFHNHIVHQTLTLYALGASDKIIHKQYNDNVSYQRPKPATSTAVISDMTNPDQFASHLGKAKQYSNFLAYFKDEINHKGWQNVLNEQLFARTPRADDMLVRLFSGKFPSTSMC